MIFDVENVLMHRGRASAARSAVAIDNQFKPLLKNRWSQIKMSKAWAVTADLKDFAKA